MKKIMIYGATGYTGSMIVQHALDAGLPIIIAGRNPHKLAAMASEKNVPFRAFELDDPGLNDKVLADIHAIINSAGPIMYTARPLMEAAIRQKIHYYMNVAAELDSYQLAETRDKSALEAGVMLLPDCGGSVTMLGCLAAHAAARVTKSIQILLALDVTGTMSRGSVVSATENVSTE